MEKNVKNFDKKIISRVVQRKKVGGIVHIVEKIPLPLGLSSYINNK